MSLENVKRYFETVNLDQQIIQFKESTATVEEAAEALGCHPRQIAKTMSFFINERPILIVIAGDTRIDNKKYKDTFHQKAKMIPSEYVEDYIGHIPGGVCPFAIKSDVIVYLDISLKRFENVYPAAGNGHSAVNLSLDELEKYSHYIKWVDVCKNWYINEENK